MLLQHCSPDEGRGKINVGCGHINATHSLSHLSPAAWAPGSDPTPSLCRRQPRQREFLLLIPSHSVLLNKARVNARRGTARSDHPLHPPLPPRCGAGSGGKPWSLVSEGSTGGEVTAEQYRGGIIHPGSNIPQTLKMET